MTYQISIEHVEARPTGVIRFRVNPAEFSRVVPQACGEVWNFFRDNQLLRPGRHLALYLDHEVNLEVGVEVEQPFPGNDRVVNSATPAGVVATTAHLGPYQRLGDAYDAISQWCANHGRALSGTKWEVYGHWEKDWEQDPSKIRTDVFWLLQPTGA